MIEKAANDFDGINFAYIRDPICPLRVVTIAYTINEATSEQQGHDQSITYALAINRIDAFRHAPTRIKNHEKSETHNKKEGRDRSAYRLRNIGSTTVGHCYTRYDENAVMAIIADHLKNHPPRKRNRRHAEETPMYLQKAFEVFLRYVERRPNPKNSEIVHWFNFKFTPCSNQ
jgi:hypothetical protein